VVLLLLLVLLLVVLMTGFLFFSATIPPQLVGLVVAIVGAAGSGRVVMLSINAAG
jgi:hypothetical protein